jgi:alanine dehydrogenase
MQVAVLKETVPGERRVAVVPAGVGALVKRSLSPAPGAWAAPR